MTETTRKRKAFSLKISPGEILQDDKLARLLTFPNVIVTAHQGFLTHEVLSEIARITIENVRRFVSKQDLLEGTVL